MGAPVGPAMLVWGRIGKGLQFAGALAKRVLDSFWFQLPLILLFVVIGFHFDMLAS